MRFNRFLTAVVLAMAVAPTAQAAEVKPPSFSQILAAAGDIVIPPEWAGIFTTEDSVYDCEGNFMEFSADNDTLCPGTPYDPEVGEFPIECNGTVTETTADIVCSASLTFKECTITYTIELHAERNGDTITAMQTFNLDYSGPFPCDLAPDECTITRSTSTRIAPAPKSCATAVDKASWGEVKTRYR